MSIEIEVITELLQGLIENEVLMVDDGETLRVPKLEVHPKEKKTDKGAKEVALFILA